MQLYQNWYDCMQYIPEMVYLQYANYNSMRDIIYMREFQGMKRAIKESIKLSPIGISQKLYAFVNLALTVGTAYILAQRK